MLVKAVVLGLVLGGIGFVANDAKAADITKGVKVFSGEKVEILGIRGCDVKTENELEKDTALANQKDLVKVNDDVIKNAEDIAAEAKARDDADKKLNAKINSNAAKVQEQLDAQDNKNKAQDASIKANGAAIKANKDAIKANADAIKANKAEADATNEYFNSRIENNTDNIYKNKVAIENETQAREDADKKLNAKINSNAAKVQEQLDAQDNKNKAQDASIKANGAAIKANKDAIKANADAIKANKAEADATNEYFNSRIENNTDNIYKNKVAIENETQARKDADNKLSDRINDEVTTRANEDKRIEAKFDGEVSRLDSKIDKLDARVEKVGAMAAAIANLHTMGYDPEAPTEIAVGVGQYRDKTGMALGAFHYPNRDFMLSFSVSTAGDEYMGGIGATWKFGRKTPEELRQAEAEKAAKAKLAKAEAAKKAAKDARVAAQQKRHAEMLAARTGK